MTSEDQIRQYGDLKIPNLFRVYITHSPEQIAQYFLHRRQNISL